MKIKECKYGKMAYLPNDTYIGGSLEAYGEQHETELQVLFQLVKEGDTVIDVGANIGTISIPIAKYVGKSGKVISFGLGDPLEGQFGITKENQCSYLSLGAEQLVPVSVLALQGESGVLNSLAALAVGHALQLPMQAMLEKLKNFKGLPHRLALVAEQDGVSWFNDSKGTNIGATISSLRSLQKNIVLIAGGVFKGGDLAQLKEAIAKHVKHVILLGQDANVLQLGIEGVSTIDIANSMNEAVEIAQKESIAGDQVLLSPACASFDMYKNYIERGSHFENCVKDLLL